MLQCVSSAIMSVIELSILPLKNVDREYTSMITMLYHSHRTVLRTRLYFTKNNNQHHMDTSLDTTERNKIVQSRVKPNGHSQK